MVRESLGTQESPEDLGEQGWSWTRVVAAGVDSTPGWVHRSSVFLWPFLSFLIHVGNGHNPFSRTSNILALCVTLGKDVIYLSLGNNNTILWLGVS